MIITKTLSSCVVLSLVLTLGACGPSPKSEPQGEQKAPTVDSSDEATAPIVDEVAYEPAYPEEVTDEGLTEEDQAQQEAGHSHEPGTADHTHDDGSTDKQDNGNDKHQR
jgi:hypothetical protein